MSNSTYFFLNFFLRISRISQALLSETSNALISRGETLFNPIFPTILSISLISSNLSRIFSKASSSPIKSSTTSNLSLISFLVKSGLSNQKYRSLVPIRVDVLFITSKREFSILPVYELATISRFLIVDLSKIIVLLRDTFFGLKICLGSISCVSSTYFKIIATDIISSLSSSKPKELMFFTS